jgi:peptide chain release factor subunit 1
MISKLREEVNEAKNIKDKKTQKIVQAGIITLIETLGTIGSQFSESPGAIFIKQKFCIVLKLPPYITKNHYSCGKSFDLSLLKTATDLRWGLLVLDTKEVTIGLFQNDNITVLDSFEAFIPNKMKAGGQSQPRFEQTRKNKVLEHIEKTSNLCNKCFDKINIERLLLGGVIPTTTNFYVNNSLNPELKKILEKPVATCYTNYNGLEQLLQKNKELYKEDLGAYLKEQTTYNNFLKERNDYYNLREACENRDYEVTNVLALTDAINLGFYCKTCSRVYLNNKECDHQKSLVKQTYPV